MPQLEGGDPLSIQPTTPSSAPLQLNAQDVRPPLFEPDTDEDDERGVSLLLEQDKEDQRGAEPALIAASSPVQTPAPSPQAVLDKDKDGETGDMQRGAEPALIAASSPVQTPTPSPQAVLDKEKDGETGDMQVEKERTNDDEEEEEEEQNGKNDEEEEEAEEEKSTDEEEEKEDEEEEAVGPRRSKRQASRSQSSRSADPKGKGKAPVRPAKGKSVGKSVPTVAPSTENPPRASSLRNQGSKPPPSKPSVGKSVPTVAPSTENPPRRSSLRNQGSKPPPPKPSAPSSSKTVGSHELRNLGDKPPIDYKLAAGGRSSGKRKNRKAKGNPEFMSALMKSRAIFRVDCRPSVLTSPKIFA